MDPGRNEAKGAGSLRSVLLRGLAVLLTVALIALSAVMLVFVPRMPSPQVMIPGLLTIIALDVALVLAVGDLRLRRLFVRPLEGMMEEAEQIAAGRYDRRLAPAGADELRRLAESVNRMADRLIRHQEQLRHNVASLNETNRELSLARHELVQSEKLAAVGRMAAGIAHEVGNPLGAIFGYLDVAERRGATDPEWIESIRHETQRIDRVVRGLLDFARPTSRTTSVFDVNRVVRETVDLLQKQGQLKTVRIDVDLEIPPPHVLGDPGHFEQILVNLLLNAEDAIQEASAPGRIQVRSVTEDFRSPSEREPARREDDPEGVDYSHLRSHRTSPDALGRFDPGDRIVRIEVTDNGVGIDPEGLASVFEPFFTTKEPGRGTGLGLAVSARLAEAMGGGMIAESRPSEGTRFALVLPLIDRELQTDVAEEVA
ncbi:MAG: ATP-binding protein [Gemmatimonadota bacterium]|nr:ATP-binding protein [Gemmatimonadota bacterium]